MTFTWDTGDAGSTTQFWEKKDTNNVASAFLVKTLAAGVTSHTIVHLIDGPPAIHDYFNWTRHKSGANFSNYAGDPSSDDGSPNPNTNGLKVQYNDGFL